MFQSFDIWLNCVPHDKWEQLNALKGVPQPEKWHPEGDSYVHTLMVCKEAWYRYYMVNAEKDANKAFNIVWCAITHDFGKALTDPVKWPSHFGHADLGIAPTKAFLREQELDDTTINICSFTTKYHMHMHQINVMKYTTLHKIFFAAVEMCGDAHYLAALELLAQLGVCDHYGRGNVDRDEIYTDTLRFLAYMYHLDSLYKTYKGTNYLTGKMRDTKKSWEFYRDYDLSKKVNRFPMYLQRANSVLRLWED